MCVVGSHPCFTCMSPVYITTPAALAIRVHLSEAWQRQVHKGPPQRRVPQPCRCTQSPQLSSELLFLLLPGVVLRPLQLAGVVCRAGVGVAGRRAEVSAAHGWKACGRPGGAGRIRQRWLSGVAGTSSCLPLCKTTTAKPVAYKNTCNRQRPAGSPARGSSQRLRLQNGWCGVWWEASQAGCLKGCRRYRHCRCRCRRR